jgi:hypothetical protein
VNDARRQKSAGGHRVVSRFTSALRPGNHDVTATGHSQTMRRLALTVLVFALLASMTATAYAGRGGGDGGRAGGSGSVPPFPPLQGTWSHAEINVTIHRTQHTLILDQGRITRATVRQITLLEPDGTKVDVALAPNTIVVVKGIRRRPAALRRKMLVETMRIDYGAAVRVRTTP